MDDDEIARRIEDHDELVREETLKYRLAVKNGVAVNSVLSGDLQRGVVRRRSIANTMGFNV